MQRFDTVLALSIGGLAALSAQTPAPSSATPLRHLEYGFSVAVQGLQGYKLSVVNGGVVTTDKAGDVADPEGGTGKMLVDIVSIAPDGALVVRIAEQVRGDPRPRQAFTCSVYGNTSVLCPSMPSPSEAEWMLLGYLGRQFVDSAPWDAKGHWARSERSTQSEVNEEFTLLDAGTKNAVIHEVKTTTLHNGGFDNQRTEVTIDYDRSQEVPDVIRADVSTAGGDEASHASYVFTLQRDSFAKP